MAAQLSRVIFIVICANLVLCDPEYVIKKLCKDVDPSHCGVQSVVVDPCPLGPAFCPLKRKKTYTVTLDVTPHFSAENLKIAIFADVDNSGGFSTSFKTPEDACEVMYCPLQAEERRIFDVDLVLDKRASGKFPVKVKLWNADDETQACCTTFNVKVNK